jgi:energy-coupling factor transporter ATP-binding protein EcfA2
MAHAPIDDIVAWSATQAPWRQDCLRRLATSADLTLADLDELLAIIKTAAGFTLPSPPPAAMPFAKAHFVGSADTPITLKGISNITGVNRLIDKASLTFCPKALTIVYGRNGSGKSGFVRILRTACRTRIENETTLKVLADVYGGGTPVQSAGIIVDTGSGDNTIEWKPGMVAAPSLMQVAVFDSSSAQLYVDGGNQIRFLPFGLALPHRLNGVCLKLKARLEAEKATEISNKISLSTITFTATRSTVAQTFAQGITKETTDAEIETATPFSPEDDARLNALTGLLTASATASADMALFASWAKALAGECEAAVTAYSDDALRGYSTLRGKAVTARDTAKIAAGALFDDEPLDGVGSESWRALWAAARDYSVSTAYAGKDFPVVADGGDPAACVLCQQPLLPDGAARIQRFQAYMDDMLDNAASQAEQNVADAKTGLPTLTHLMADDFSERAEQVRARDPALADSLLTFHRAVVARSADALARLDGAASVEVPKLVSHSAVVSALDGKLGDEQKALAEASEAGNRKQLETEKAELEDRQHLHANKAPLVTRRNLMVVEAAYKKALTLVRTTGITKLANELLDTHLTSAVVTRFDAERKEFGIEHLKVGLTRKSDQTKAEYETDTQTALTKVTSQILSEGEQRALALTGFLTEVALTDGSGPIVIDDPVSSLDRDRSILVAKRIAREAMMRQVIVFTHDIVFFNELCKAADSVAIEPVTISLFSDQDAAGKIDAAGMVWKGLNVAKRIGQIKSKFAPLPKLYSNSPSDYEYEIKGLYGRLRDTYERMVEETIFSDIVRRGTDVIQTQLLRCVTLPDDLAIQFHEGMTRANTHSHDNPAADTVPLPTPTEFTTHLADLEALITDFNTAKKQAETNRPQMRPKK